jgi:hypothetical protein
MSEEERETGQWRLATWWAGFVAHRHPDALAKARETVRLFPTACDALGDEWLGEPWRVPEWILAHHATDAVQRGSLAGFWAQLSARGRPVSDDAPLFGD